VKALALVLVAFAAFSATPHALAQREAPRHFESVPVAGLPAEARRSVALIRQGGPFPYARDGVVFGNREGRLPREKRGYYREYTVPTPGSHNRGARRIVAGGRGELYYSDDHYGTFRRIRD
jgi:ribonuclease T1